MKTIIALYCVLLLVATPLVFYFSWNLYENPDFIESLLSGAHGVIVEALILAILVQILTRRHERKLYVEGKLAELNVYRTKRLPEHVVAMELVIRDLFRIGYNKQLSLANARLDAIDLHSIGESSGVSLNFTSALMHQARLDMSRLVDCDFAGADLYKASFRDAQLVNCNFRDADVTDVDWSGVTIEKTDLSTSKQLDIEMLNTQTRRIDELSRASLEKLQADHEASAPSIAT